MLPINSHLLRNGARVLAGLWLGLTFGCSGPAVPKQDSGGDGSKTSDAIKKVSNASSEFGVFWPPRDLGRPLRETDEPLLRGELSVFETAADRRSGSFQLQVTLRRPHAEAERTRWNENLAFPEYSWMAQVRVWDRDKRWLWPNLPYLLRAHGEERLDRYGGVDPGKGVDNDFAAVLIRPLTDDADSRGPAGLLSKNEWPLVSAEWHPVDAESISGRSIVHTARSDALRIQGPSTADTARSATLGVWLIYADFLDAPMPRSWPAEGEWAGGILAYFEVTRQRDHRDTFRIVSRVPPTSTGFDWESWFEETIK